MKRKSLYVLALLLCLSTVASSNERARFRCRTSGKTDCPAAASTPASAAATPTASAIPATPSAAEESTNGSENHLFLHTFIKLLYI